MSSYLELRTDEQQLRHFLDGKPIPRGTRLELFQNGEWIEGFYQWTGRERDRATFHQGGTWQPIERSDRLRWPSS